MTGNRIPELNETEEVSNMKIAIVGGGLVGSLTALSLSKLGYDIHLYEYREDIRKSELVVGRSINLALSVRGRKTLAEVGLEKEILEHGIPMRGRMLHDRKGYTKFLPYDANTKQCIYSVGRKHLNEILLTNAELQQNIHLHFNHKLTKSDLPAGELTFINPVTHQTTRTYADLIVGCDGAFSAVRKQMLQRYGFDYSQTYIEHGYIELCIPPVNGKFAMPHNYLHIWPRGQFMMIALPNQDFSWTVTLFMPLENFHQLKTEKELLSFFEGNFSDAIPLIGRKRLVDDFFKTKPQHLISVKCHPYHLNSKVVLLGDAAHAMVPFFGQGMNSGFEDVSIFSSILKQSKNNFELALNDFTNQRWRDAHTICDLAMNHYIEMRDLVTKTSYRTRKIFDEYLFWMMPTIWVPLYNSVTFSTMPYEQCRKNRQWQDKILKRMLILFVGFVFFCLAMNFLKW